MIRGSVFDEGSPAPRPTLTEVKRASERHIETEEEIAKKIKELEVSIEEKKSAIEEKRKSIALKEDEIKEVTISMTPGEKEKMERLKSRTSLSTSLSTELSNNNSSSPRSNEVQPSTPNRREERRKKSEGLVKNIDEIVSDAKKKSTKKKNLEKGNIPIQMILFYL